ncbi:MAG: hypothetical protein ACM3U1_06790 [Chloroflexota bacterium]
MKGISCLAPVAVLVLALVSCDPSGRPKEELPGNDSASSVVKDSFKTEPIKNAKKASSLAWLVERGSGVYLTAPQDAFEAQGMIRAAKDPSKIIISTKNFSKNDIIGFLRMGAKVVIESSDLTDADLASTLDSAERLGRLDDITLLAFDADFEKASAWAARGINFRIGPNYTPLEALHIARKAGGRVEIFAEGFAPSEILSFMREGALVTLTSPAEKYSEKRLAEFAKAGGERFKALAWDLPPKTCETILKNGGKVILGLFTMPAEDILRLAKAYPGKVTVFGNTLSQQEIEQISKYADKFYIINNE